MVCNASSFAALALLEFYVATFNEYIWQINCDFHKGQGVWLWDDQGEQYLDALSGIAVTGLGHSHPDFVKAINAQASTLIHVSNVYHIAEQAQLADKIAAISGMDKVFLQFRL